MDSDFRKIFLQLKKTGVVVRPRTLRRHHVQGFMSHVFVIDSNKGKLIIHLNTIHPEQRRLKSWERVLSVGRFLDAYPNVPSAHVFLSGTIGKKYFIVQELLPGKVAGERLRKGDQFVDTWYHWSKKLGENIEKTIARIHAIPVRGSGWVIRRGDVFSGAYPSWHIFLERELHLWLKKICKAE